MPYSVAEGKAWAAELYQADHTIRQVVDVGPGSGTWSKALRHLRVGVTWTGIEVWPGYVAEFDLLAQYDQLVVGNVLDQDLGTFNVDLVIFGDVIEHLEHDDAVRLLEAVKRRARRILVSIPIVESIQGAFGGNEYEAHRYQWTAEEMDELLPGALSERGSIVGTWWWHV